MAEKNSEGRYEETIDGKSYSFEKWGAEDATATLLKIFKIVGKPLGMVMGQVAEAKLKGGDEKISLLDLDVSADFIGTVFDSLLEKMDEASALSLLKKLSSEKVLCEGAQIKFNTHYEDQLPHMFKVAYENLGVQYGNFFDAFQGLVGKRKKGISNRPK